MLATMLCSDWNYFSVFVNWKEGDFRLNPESPALKLGIKSLDLSDVGITSDFPDKFR